MSITKKCYVVLRESAIVSLPILVHLKVQWLCAIAP